MTIKEREAYEVIRDVDVGLKVFTANTIGTNVANASVKLETNSKLYKDMAERFWRQCIAV